MTVLLLGGRNIILFTEN